MNKKPTLQIYRLQNLEIKAYNEKVEKPETSVEEVRRVKKKSTLNISKPVSKMSVTKQVIPSKPQKTVRFEFDIQNNNTE